MHECFRVPKPGAILRIVVHDLGFMVRDYFAAAADPMASHRFISRLLLTSSVRDLVHAGAHHKQMFDTRSLFHMLQESVFRLWSQVAWRQRHCRDWGKSN